MFDALGRALDKTEAWARRRGTWRRAVIPGARQRVFAEPMRTAMQIAALASRIFRVSRKPG